MLIHDYHLVVIVLDYWKTLSHSEKKTCVEFTKKLTDCMENALYGQVSRHIFIFIATQFNTWM